MSVLVRTSDCPMASSARSAKQLNSSELQHTPLRCSTAWVNSAGSGSNADGTDRKYPLLLL